jgi:hypothetical protein
MWQRLLLGFLLAIGAYCVVKYFSKEGFVGWIVKNEVQAQGTMVQEPMPRGDLIVASGGPNSPNAAPPVSMPPSVSPSPEASDPYDETSELADASESLRNPERSFGPGIVPEQTAIASASGIAGPVATSSQAFQSRQKVYSKVFRSR